MKARFYAYTPARELVRDFDVSDFIVTEDGEERKILSVTCPQYNKVDSISSVLVMDVSESMDFAGNLELAQKGADIWIDRMNPDFSECAVTAFNHTCELLTDFTNDKAKLYEAVDSLDPLGMTNYNAALLNPPAGALIVSERGKSKKVIIMLTDGSPTSVTEVNAIIEEANRQEASLFGVIIKMFTPLDLARIAEETGGKCFDRIRTEDDIITAYLQILLEVQGIEPCELVWESENQCSANMEGNISCLINGEDYDFKYRIEDEDIARLSVSPAGVSFGKVPPGETRDTTVTITVENGPFEIRDIIKNCDDYTVSPDNVTVHDGEEVELTITYTPKDSSFRICKFDILADPCDDYFYASGGFNTTMTFESSLKLTRPDGGEEFVMGTDEEITWEGILPEEEVKLEYSFDKGISWHTIAEEVSGLSYTWKDIPLPGSDKCLMRINPISYDSVVKVNAQNPYIYDIAWEPNGSTIASGGNGSLKLHDGIELFQVVDYSFNFLMKDIEWISGTKRVAVMLSDSIFEIDLLSGTIKNRFSVNFGIFEAKASPDGNQLALSVVSGDDKRLLVYNTSTWSVESDIEMPNTMNYFDWSPDSERIYGMTVDSELCYIDVPTSTITDTFKLTGEHYSQLAVNDDETGIVFSEYGEGIVLWDIEKKEEIRTNIYSGYIAYPQFMNDCSTIVFSDSQGDAIFMNAYTGEIVRTLSDPDDSFVRIELSPDNSRLATTHQAGVLKLWNLNLISQEDVSDSLWAIKVPELTGIDVDMGKVILDNQKDSVVTAFIENLSPYTALIDSIIIKGAGYSHFEFVTGKTVDTIPGKEKRDFEIRFSPFSEGEKNAVAVVYARSGKLYLYLKGEGVDPLVKVTDNLIDFGLVNLGDSKDTLGALTLKNVGSERILISKATIKGMNTELFEILKGNAPFDIEPGATATMDIRFTPEEIGRFSGRIEFEFEGIGSPAVLQLFGEGTNAPRIVCSEPDTTLLICSSEARDTVLIKNTGPKALEIEEIELKGNDAGLFVVDNHAPLTIQPGGEYIIPYDIKPTQTGCFDAELYIKSNSNPHPEFRVKLTGRKERVEIRPERTLYDFGTLEKNSTRDTLIKIENPGTIETAYYFETSSGISCNTSMIKLYPGQSVNVNVSILDTSTEGNIDESLTISDSVCNNSREVLIKGLIQGISEMSVNIENNEPLVCKSRDTISVTIANNGSKKMTISSVKTENNNADDFEADIALPIGILPGESKEFPVYFSPSAIGDRTCELIIESDAPDAPFEKTISARKDSISFETSSYAIDLGMLCPGETLDTAMSVAFYGTISADLAVEASSDKITVFDELIGEPNTSEELSFSFTAPEIDAEIDELITLTEPICGKVIDVLITGKVVSPVIEASDCIFTSFSGDSETKDIEIKNTSERDVIIETCSGLVAPFSLVGNPFPLSIAAGESGIIQIEYAPTDENPANIQISFEGSPCDTKKAITLSGNSISAELVLRTGDFEAYPGDKIFVPVTIVSAENISNSDMSQMSCVLSFNHTLLYPTGFAFTSEDESTALINIDLDMSSFESGSKIAEIEFDVALGNAVDCNLELSNFIHDGKPINVIADPGKFSLLGICDEGGTRLVNPGETIGIKGINPNPAGNEINISLGLIESGYTELAIYNSRGERVATLLSENVESFGERKIKANVSELSTGLYMVVLTTPTLKESIPAVIMK
jgi:hypothetical protein